MSDAIDRLRVRSAVRDLERDNLSLDDDDEDIVGAGAYRWPEETDYDRGWNACVDVDSSVMNSGSASSEYARGYNDALAGKPNR